MCVYYVRIEQTNFISKPTCFFEDSNRVRPGTQVKWPNDQTEISDLFEGRAEASSLWGAAIQGSLRRAWVPPGGAVTSRIRAQTSPASRPRQVPAKRSARRGGDGNAYGEAAGIDESQA